MGDFLDLNEFRELYDNKPIYVFDTNIYIDLLRYSKSTNRESRKCESN